MLEIFGNIFLAMMLWGFINLIINTIRIRRMVKKYKDNPNVKGVHMINGKVKIIPNEEENEIEIEEENEEENKNYTGNPDIDFELLNYVPEKSKLEAIDISDEIVVDSVCGCKVMRKDAYHIMRDNQSFYFCSWDCREEFLKQ